MKLKTVGLYRWWRRKNGRKSSHRRWWWRLLGTKKISSEWGRWTPLLLTLHYIFPSFSTQQTKPTPKTRNRNKERPSWKTRTRLAEKESPSREDRSRWGEVNQNCFTNHHIYSDSPTEDGTELCRPCAIIAKKRKVASSYSILQDFRTHSTKARKFPLYLLFP